MSCYLLFLYVRRIKLFCFCLWPLFKENIALRLCCWGFWLIRGSALCPIGGLSARQSNSCLPRTEDKDEEDYHHHSVLTMHIYTSVWPLATLR